jgi:hypothetical protein
MTVITKFTRRAALALALGGFAGGAYAAANGDGSCSSAELGSYECANFGTSVIEFLGSFASTQCPLAAGGTAQCTAYYYRYSGASSNQVNIAIPNRVTKTFKTAADIHCSQFLTGGAGDPTTGFGKNQLSINICRIAQNLAGAPLDVSPPAGANFVIVTDPSAYDKNNPLDWQLKLGSNCSDDDRRNNRSGVFAASLLGPFGPQLDVLESAVTLTTPTGQSVSYTNSAGNIKITGGSARIVPQGGTKLCVINEGGDPSVPYTSSSFAANWTCETITYATDQCDIKTDGGDPCRMIGGVCIKY